MIIRIVRGSATLYRYVVRAGRVPGTVRKHRGILQTFFSLVGINFLLAGLSFVTTFMIANTLGREMFGELSYALAVGSYCLTIVSCGIDQTLVRDLLHHPNQFDRYASASLCIRGVMFLAAMSGVLFLNAFAGSGDRLGLAGLAIVAAEGIKALNMAPLYDAWSHMKRHAVYLLLERCVYFAGIWGAFVMSPDSLRLPLIALLMALSAILGLGIQYHWARRHFTLHLGRELLWQGFRMLRGNVWVWGAMLATLSFGAFSKIVLKHVSGSGQLGGYSVAWQIVPLGYILIYQVGRIGSPRLARLVREEPENRIVAGFVLRYVLLATLAGAFVGAPAILFPGIILDFFKPEYASVATTLQILGLYVILIGVGQVAVQYLITVRKERAYALVVIITGLLAIGLYTICIPKWSAKGAAMSVVLAHGTAILVYLVLVFRHIFAHFGPRLIARASPENP